MQLASVPFYQDNLVLINQNNEPFVAMRPIVVQMGLDWGTQYRKIEEKFNSTIVIMTTVGEDGKMREMICLPLRKLPAWLYSISPNKVAPEIKDKVIQYQEECDDVLWQYWTKGFAGNVQANKASVAYLKYRLQLIDKLEKEIHSVKREAIYEQLKLVSEELGLTTPEMDSLGFKSAYEEILSEFWEFYSENQGRFNHSTNDNMIAINLNEVLKPFIEYRGESLTRSTLQQAFQSCESPKYIENKTVFSVLKKVAVRCYIFAGNV